MNKPNNRDYNLYHRCLFLPFEFPSHPNTSDFTSVQGGCSLCGTPALILLVLGSCTSFFVFLLLFCSLTWVLSWCIFPIKLLFLYTRASLSISDVERLVVGFIRHCALKPYINNFIINIIILYNMVLTNKVQSHLINILKNF